MNEEYANEAETTTPDRATLDRKAEQARARQASKTRRKEAVQALDEMKAIKVQKAVGRARRSKTTTTRDGRVRAYRIGQNVASMCTWLLFWEGKGELSGGWIHKALAEWMEETELTESMVKTARRIGKEEGLWEEEEHLRSDDRWVVKYRLDVVRLLRIANDSEIENVEARIARAKNNRSKLSELQRELERLEAVRDEMGLFDAPPDTPEDDDTDAEDGNASTPPANLTGVPREHGTPSPSISHDYRGVPQGSTAGDVAYSDHSMEDEAVAPGEDDALVAMEEKTDEHMTSVSDSEACARGSDPSEAEENGCARTVEDYHGIYDRLAALMRGGDGLVERFCGRMTSRHLEGQGFSFERLARILRRSVPVRPEMGDQEFAGIVREVLDKVRAEHERQREATRETTRAAVDEVGGE